METKNIILTEEHRGGGKSTSFSGRPEGESVRVLLNLDEKDNDEDNYKIVIPAGTTAFNPSFFLGLLYKSINHLGLRKFSTKYNFDYNLLSGILKELIENDIIEGMRTASNEINLSTGLD